MSGFVTCFAPSTSGDWAQSTSQISMFGTIPKRESAVINCAFGVRLDFLGARESAVINCAFGVRLDFFGARESAVINCD